jgi:hypothetical protein
VEDYFKTRAQAEVGEGPHVVSGVVETSAFSLIMDEDEAPFTIAGLRIDLF